MHMHCGISTSVFGEYGNPNRDCRLVSSATSRGNKETKKKTNQNMRSRKNGKKRIKGKKNKFDTFVHKLTSGT